MPTTGEGVPLPADVDIAALEAIIEIVDEVVARSKVVTAVGSGQEFARGASTAAMSNVSSKVVPEFEGNVDVDIGLIENVEIVGIAGDGVLEIVTKVEEESNNEFHFEL
ncbi:hypothetical protein ACLOJK_011166 [Asimina triloba]